MANRTDNNAPPYTEAQTKAWLSWLARGMQQHEQTVFMLELLQPSWLTTSKERAVYTLSSRILTGVLYGLILGTIVACFSASIVVIVRPLMFGFILGLSVGLFDALRFMLEGVQTSPRPGPKRWQHLKRFLINEWFLIVPVAFIWFLAMDLDLLEDSGFWVFIAFFVVAGVRRTSHRSLATDIQSVETLTWSWAHFWKGGILFGCIVGMIVGLLLAIVLREISAMLGTDVDLLDVAGPALIGAAICGVIGGLVLGGVAGLRPGVIDMKTAPNQGMNLSTRWACFSGLVFGLVVTLIFEFVFYLSGGGFVVGLLAGVIVWPMSALYFGLWFGGLDVIQHYLLRLMLDIRGHAPLNYVRFLDYAAHDLNFLQKVGGGYVFIHRILLEHFAAMDNEAKSNPQDTPALTAQTPFDPVSGI